MFSKLLQTLTRVLNEIEISLLFLKKKLKNFAFHLLTIICLFYIHTVLIYLFIRLFIFDRYKGEKKKACTRRITFIRGEETIKTGPCGIKNSRRTFHRDRSEGSSDDSRLRGSRRSILIGLPHVFERSSFVWTSR